MADKIDSFSGDYRFLSNFYPAPTLYEGVLYKTSEHAFQAAKSIDPDERKKVAACKTAGEAKKAGRRDVTLRDGWDSMRNDVMRAVLRAKFTSVQNEHLKERLLETGDAELVEGNDWGDKYWGCVNGHGENWLGRLLMELRSELR